MCKNSHTLSILMCKSSHTLMMCKSSHWTLSATCQVVTVSRAAFRQPGDSALGVGGGGSAPTPPELST